MQDKRFWKKEPPVIDTIEYNGKYTDVNEFRKKLLSVIGTCIFIIGIVAVGSFLI